jgi:hypothetical protein
MGVNGDPESGNVAANNSTIAYHAGKVYLSSSRGGLILDPDSGRVIAGKFSPRGDDGRAVPETALSLLFAGDRVYGFGKLGGGAYKTRLPGRRGSIPDPKGRAWVEVFSLDGKPLARNVVYAPTDVQSKNDRLAIAHNKFSYPYAFTIAGDCLLLRSTWDVVCISRSPTAKGER